MDTNIDLASSVHIHKNRCVVSALLKRSGPWRLWLYDSFLHFTLSTPSNTRSNKHLRSVLSGCFLITVMVRIGRCQRLDPGPIPGRRIFCIINNIYLAFFFCLCGHAVESSKCGIVRVDRTCASMHEPGSHTLSCLPGLFLCFFFF